MDGGRPLRFGTVSPADCADGDAEMTHRDLDCVLPALRNLSAGTVVEYFGIRIIRNANESESEMIDEERQIGEAMAALPVIGRRLYGSLMAHPMNAGRSLGQVKALGYLYRAGPAALSDLARELGISLPTASELVDRLLEDGLADRAVNPADRRKVLIDLTPLARDLGRQFHDMRHAQIRAALGSLPEEHRSSFVPVLNALVEALQRAPHELPGYPLTTTDSMAPPDTPAEEQALLPTSHGPA
ncbi:MAG TPA: MarR family transcriptional regulator [Thermomicrobiales bacterium]|jgi:DNA-binding MarR family transcriptional regulator|nr:hypothetical protein [Chloroflexota bacterium]HQX62427.1 MarR family transcriptional regulator [Thermomicrobiales bacterium]HBY47716.1 hypothetical protein [Chloroflexota bacterium]HCG30832.1 hypothetical protein [Chloroflexota bacterium]HQZ90528.1 MarR family transcriptional regulator [Thermomicrobiales bacterium]